MPRTQSRFDQVFHTVFVANRSVVFGVLTALLVAWNIRKSIHCGQLSYCADTYWASFWLISYEDGFTRRALLGTIVRYLFGTEISALLVNVMALGVAILLVGAILQLCLRLLASIRPAASEAQFALWCCVAALLSGPTVTVLFETMGDPLQVALLLSCLLFTCRNLRSLPLKVAIFAAVSLLSLAIHEASLFMTLPVNYLVLFGRKPGVGFTIAGLGAVTVVAALFSVVFTAQPTTSLGMLVLRDGSIASTTALLPSYENLIRAELDAYFSSLSGVKDLIVKSIGAFIWPAIFVIFFGAVFGDRALLWRFLSLVIISSPLYVVAHDWGRFSSHTLLLSLIPFAGQMTAGIGYAAGPSEAGRIAYLAPAFPLLFMAHETYRIGGVLPSQVPYLCIALVLAVLLLHGRTPGATERA